MRDETVARNYAETLFELAQRHEGTEAFGDSIETVARLIDENMEFRIFLETPRISAPEKKELLKKVFEAKVPKHLLHFLLITIEKRRQRLLRAIAAEFHTLVDAHLGREHVQVTVARPLDEEALTGISEDLSRMLGRTAIPHFRVRPEILGGVVVRAGDTIYDGSLRRKIDRMRHQLLSADLPETA